MTHAHHSSPTSVPRTSVLEVALRNCHDASEFVGLEAKLQAIPGVKSVHLDRTRGVAHLGYNSQAVSQSELEKRLQAAGYACDCADCQPSDAQPGQPAVGDEGHAAGMNHDAHAGHGESMVNDMLRRFMVSLLLTLPIVLYSPIGALVGFTAPPPFGLSMAWFGLILSTPVVWWGGWPFISAPGVPCGSARPT